MSIRVTGRSTKKRCDISMTELEKQTNCSCYSDRASAKLDLTQWIFWTNPRKIGLDDRLTRTD